MFKLQTNHKTAGGLFYPASKPAPLILLAAGILVLFIAGWGHAAGSLQVTITPPAAVDSGAAWRRVGTSTWFSGGQTETGVTAGSYTVEFKDSVGWVKPANIGVSVSDSTLTTAAAYYSLNHDLIIGAGASSWEYPLNTYFHNARTQSIYLASEIGGPRIITGFALDVTTIPGMTMSNFTIRMKPTALSSYGSSPMWYTGWTTVYQATTTILDTGWVEFDFIAPYNFSYSDGNNVVVDISFRDTTYAPKGYSRYSTTSGFRTICGVNDNLNDNPLTWSGTSPSFSSWYRVPNIMFTVTSRSDANRDLSVDFLDFAIIAAKWQQFSCSAANQWCEGADVNRSGIVNYADLFEFASHWLE